MPIDKELTDLFVQEAGYNDDSWHCVKKGVDTDAKHKLFQFICFGTATLHQCPHLKKKKFITNGLV